MKPRHDSILYTMILLILTVSQGCGPVTKVAPTAPVKEATRIPTPTPTPVKPESLFSQTTKIYVHQSGAFQLPSLEGWQVNEAEDGVVFSAPDSNTQVRITVTNVGREFEHAALEYFAFNTEDALYVHQNNYKLLNIASDPNTNSVTLEKSFSMDGKPYYNDAIYQQEGQIVYMVEVTAQTAQDQPYGQEFSQLVKSIKYDPAKAGELPVYGSTHTFTAPENTFSFEIPFSWFPNTFSPDPQTEIAKITSPDAMGVIQIILYNNSVIWNEDQVRQAVLNLLNKDFTEGAGNFTFSASFRTQDGRRSRLEWASRHGGYAGSTYYETRGKQLILFTLAYKTEAASLYQPLMKRLANTYNMAVATPTVTTTP